MSTVKVVEADFAQQEKKVLARMTNVDEINRALTTAAMEDQKDVVEDVMSSTPTEEPEWYDDFDTVAEKIDEKYQNWLQGK